MKTLLEILMEEDERRTRLLDRDRMPITTRAGAISSGYTNAYSDGYNPGKKGVAISLPCLKGESKMPNYFPTSNPFSQAALQNTAYSPKADGPPYVIALFQLSSSYLRNVGVLGQEGIKHDYKTPNLFDPNYLLNSENGRRDGSSLYGVGNNQNSSSGLYPGGVVMPRVTGIIDSISGIYIGGSGCKSCGVGGSGGKAK